MKDAVFTGADVAEALQNAARSLGVDATRLNHVVLDPGTPGGLGRSATQARIAVMLDGPPAASARSEGRKPRASSPASPAPGPTESMEDVVAGVARALEGAVGAPLTLTCREDADHISVTPAGEGASMLEDGSGETLDALEVVLQRMAARLRDPRRLAVVNPARRAQREASLRDAALRLAADVKERGLPRMMPPLNSYERRIVHMALAEVPGIKTYSVGEGQERRLTIALASEPTAE